MHTFRLWSHATTLQLNAPPARPTTAHDRLSKLQVHHHVELVIGRAAAPGLDALLELLSFCVRPEVDTFAPVAARWDMGQGMCPTTDHWPVASSYASMMSVYSWWWSTVVV